MFRILSMFVRAVMNGPLGRRLTANRRRGMPHFLFMRHRLRVKVRISSLDVLTLCCV